MENYKFICNNYECKQIDYILTVCPMPREPHSTRDLRTSYDET